MDTDWPPGTESWDPIVISPVVTRSKTRTTSHSPSVNKTPTVARTDDTDITDDNDLDDDEFFDAPSESIAYPDHSPVLHNSSSDLSLPRIKLEQHSDHCHR